MDKAGKKTTESTPMPNAEEPNPNPIEISPIDNVEDTTGNTPETVKDESQKRTSFTERLAMMVGMRKISNDGRKSRKAKHSEQYPREQQRPIRTRVRGNRDQ